MKVLQIINSLGTGGAEKLLLDTIPLYRRAGIEMDILLFWNDNHQFVNALRELNCCTVYILNESSKVNDIYKLSNIFRIKKILKNYHVAHVHLFPAQYFTAVANMLNLNSCKLVFTEHNVTNGRMVRKYWKPLERFIYSHYCKVVCISEEIEVILKNYLSPNNKILLKIENGVNLSVIENSIGLPLSEISDKIDNDDVLIIQVSAFRKQKDQATLIKALSLIPNKNIKLLFVGDGEERGHCENLVNSYHLNDRVIFLGQRMDIPGLLKSAHIIVLSSFYEGLSLSSIEGMASGKPFVASDVPGLRDIVAGAGVLFECGNEKELASKILKLMADQEYYNEVARLCRLRANNYDIALMVDKHIQLYRSVYGA